MLEQAEFAFCSASTLFLPPRLTSSFSFTSCIAMRGEQFKTGDKEAPQLPPLHESFQFCTVFLLRRISFSAFGGITRRLLYFRTIFGRLFFQFGRRETCSSIQKLCSVMYFMSHASFPFHFARARQDHDYDIR